MSDVARRSAVPAPPARRLPDSVTSPTGYRCDAFAACRRGLDGDAMAIPNKLVRAVGLQSALGCSQGDFLTILRLSPPMPSRVGETHDRWIPARRTLAGVISVRSSMQSMAMPSGSSAARMSRKQPSPADRPRMKMFAVLYANGAPDTIRDLHLLRALKLRRKSAAPPKGAAASMQRQR